MLYCHGRCYCTVLYCCVYVFRGPVTLPEPACKETMEDIECKFYMMSTDEWENLLLCQRDGHTPVLYRTFKIQCPCTLRIITLGDAPQVVGTLFLKTCQSIHSVFNLKQDPHFQRQPAFVKQGFQSKFKEPEGQNADRPDGQGSMQKVSQTKTKKKQCYSSGAEKVL